MDEAVPFVAAIDCCAGALGGLGLPPFGLLVAEMGGQSGLGWLRGAVATVV